MTSLTCRTTSASLWIQRRHNRKSLAPHANFLLDDYPNMIQIRLENTGVGPMLIDKFSANFGDNYKPDLISCLSKPPKGVFWDAHFSDFKGVCIAQGSFIHILKLSGNHEKQEFTEFREMIRSELRNLTIRVEYKNIYGEKMLPVTRSLEWFGRK